MCLYLNTLYMTALKSDALAEQDGWPTFGVPTSVGPSWEEPCGNQVAQTASLRKLAACAAPAKRDPPAKLCPYRR
jgi:hypothetical protein